MRLFVVFLFAFLFGVQITFAQKKNIKTYPRVKVAYQEKEKGLKADLKKIGVNLSNVELLLVGLKKERDLQAWVRNKGSKKYQLFRKYPFCSFSGELGPKRQMGDGQIPEGLYKISYFNPWSNFYLSMKVNYPNRSDKIRGKRGSLGGDIFIHGSCVTIGCIPITDDLIKELFVLSVEANRNRKVGVFLLPQALNPENLDLLKKEFPEQKNAHMLWAELMPVYQFFEKNASLPKVYTDKKGKYYIPK